MPIYEPRGWTITMRIRVVAIVVALSATLGGAPARADFTVPFTIGNGGHYSNARADIDSHGRIVFVWSWDDDGNTFKVNARVRSASGTLGDSVLLAYADNPFLDLNPGGKGVAAYTAHEFHDLQANRISSKGLIGPGITIADSSNHLLGLSVDADRNALFCFQHQGDQTLTVRVLSAKSVLSPANTLIHYPADIDGCQIKLLPNGDSIFVWTRNDGTSSKIQTRNRSAAGVLGPVQNVAGINNGRIVFPQIAVLPDGQTIFVWEILDGANLVVGIKFRVLSATGVFGPVQTLSSRGEQASLAVAVDSQGTALFVWGYGGTIRARSRSAGGILSGVQTIASGSFALLGVDGVGNALIVWPSSRYIQARTRSPSGALGVIQNIAGDGQKDLELLSLATNSYGNAVVMWKELYGGGYGSIFWAAVGRTY